MSGKKKKKFEAVNIEKLINFAEQFGIIPERTKSNVSLHACEKNRENTNSHDSVKLPYTTKIHFVSNKKRRYSVITK